MFVCLSLALKFKNPVICFLLIDMHNNHVVFYYQELLGGEALVNNNGFEKVWSTVKDRYLKDGRPVCIVLYLFLFCYKWKRKRPKAVVIMNSIIF